MTPGTLILTIYQGSTFKRIIRLTDSTPEAIDLTGATARMHIRAAITDTATLIELTEANGRALITDEVGGEVTLVISATDTAALSFSKAVYDLEIEYNDGTVDRVLAGTVKLSKEVTR